MRSGLKAATLTLAGFAVSAMLVACAEGPCRQLRRPELAAQVVSPNGTTPAAPGGEIDRPKTSEGRVLVFKPDGSLQCGMAKGLSAEEMEAQLNGIKVYSSGKRPDGMMHIQVCGSATGMVNLYEIPESSLVDAGKRGFKRFESQ